MVKIIFAVVGVLFSIFYSWKAVDIFANTKDEWIKEKTKLWSWRFHQRWLNFVASLAGWAAAYYLTFFRIIPISSFSFKIEDIVPIVVALLGVTGLLPYTLSKLTSIK